MNYFSSASGMSQQLGAVAVTSVVASGRVTGDTFLASKTPVGGAIHYAIGDGDSGMGESADDVVNIVSLSTIHAQMTSGNTTIIGPILSGDASATGHFSMAAGKQIKADPGTAELPGVTFVGDLNSGIYGNASDLVGISAGGTVRGFGNTSGWNFDIAYGNTTSLTTSLILTEVSAPAAVANAGVFYAVDVAGKTGVTVKAGAGGSGPTAADTVAGYIALED